MSSITREQQMTDILRMATEDIERRLSIDIKSIEAQKEGIKSARALINAALTDAKLTKLATHIDNVIGGILK